MTDHQGDTPCPTYNRTVGAERTRAAIVQSKNDISNKTKPSSATKNINSLNPGKSHAAILRANNKTRVLVIRVVERCLTSQDFRELFINTRTCLNLIRTQITKRKEQIYRIRQEISRKDLDIAQGDSQIPEALLDTSTPTSTFNLSSPTGMKRVNKFEDMVARLEMLEIDGLGELHRRMDFDEGGVTVAEVLKVLEEAILPKEYDDSATDEDETD